ncbi:berberine bridge enzyme-like 8 [Silene latifolia]|uniref:berberine bridge enzyme-like 8 n=1 Tax=Silene latifolia TaxID=37657 RepID=UPI003D78AB3F
MESQYLYLTTLLLLIFSFISNVASNPLYVDGFLRCLPSHAKSSIDRAIYHPNTPAFSKVLQAYIHNERFNKTTTPKPLLIIAARDETHVQATVICAKENHIDIRIRSGGHDYEGLSYTSKNPFLLLDMFNLRAIDIDLASETVWAQAGAILGELYYKIANVSKKHAFPSGVCPSIGLGGHISGGGYGNLIRKYGISADHVIDARVVTADGDILDKRTMGEDLFWAIRGGGAASFAVVLAWKLKLVRVPETVTVFNVAKTLEEGATDVVLQWQDFASNAKKDLFIRIEPHVVNGTTAGSKTIGVKFIGMYLGSAKKLTKYLKKSFPLLGLQVKDGIEIPWIKSVQYWFGIPLDVPTEAILSRVPSVKYFAKFRSDYVQKPISRAGYEAIWKKMIELDVMYMQFNPYGGRMAEIPDYELPFPHRAGNLFKIQYNGVWFVDGLADQFMNASRELYDTMEPFVSKHPREHFLNYRDIDVGTNDKENIEFAKSYFKDNLPRLLATKAQVDPDNFFRYEQSIPVLDSPQ